MVRGPRVPAKNRRFSRRRILDSDDELDEAEDEAEYADGDVIDLKVNSNKDENPFLDPNPEILPADLEVAQIFIEKWEITTALAAANFQSSP